MLTFVLFGRYQISLISMMSKHLAHPFVAQSMLSLNRNPATKPRAPDRATLPVSPLNVGSRFYAIWSVRLWVGLDIDPKTRESSRASARVPACNGDDRAAVPAPLPIPSLWSTRPTRRRVCARCRQPLEALPAGRRCPGRCKLIPAAVRRHRISTVHKDHNCTEGRSLVVPRTVATAVAGACARGGREPRDASAAHRRCVTPRIQSTGGGMPAQGLSLATPYL
jgi:hypothetical protein